MFISIQIQLNHMNLTSNTIMFKSTEVRLSNTLSSFPRGYSREYLLRLLQVPTKSQSKMVDCGCGSGVALYHVQLPISLPLLLQFIRWCQSSNSLLLLSVNVVSWSISVLTLCIYKFQQFRMCLLINRRFFEAASGCNSSNICRNDKIHVEQILVGVDNSPIIVYVKLVYK